VDIEISSSQPLPDFLGISWGATQEEALAMMEEREGVIYVEQASGRQNLLFTGGLFANKDVKTWVLQFGHNGMHTAKVDIHPPRAALIQEYEDVNARLSREYGPPAEVSQPQYRIYTFGSGGELEGSIACQQSPDGHIVISYQHQRLNLEAMGRLTGLDAPVGRAGSPQPGGGCFIATAAYGEVDHPDVAALRSFRDRVLLPTPTGRAAVRLYYAWSPPIARLVERNDRARELVRRFLVAPLAGVIRKASQGQE
jgi:hypothetical protein